MRPGPVLAVAAALVALAACSSSNRSSASSSSYTLPAPITTAAPSTDASTSSASSTAGATSTSRATTTVKSTTTAKSTTTTAKATTTTAKATTTTAKSTTTVASAPCSASAMIGPVRAALDQPGVLTVKQVDIQQCKAPYARVLAVPQAVDTSNSYENEQVFLKAVSGVWQVLTYGTGIDCATDTSFSPPELEQACKVLGLR